MSFGALQTNGHTATGTFTLDGVGVLYGYLWTRQADNR